MNNTVEILFHFADVAKAYSRARAVRLWKFCPTDAKRHRKIVYIPASAINLSEPTVDVGDKIQK